jgi:hypothetical protein
VSGYTCALKAHLINILVDCAVSNVVAEWQSDSSTQFALVRSRARILEDAVDLYTGFVALVGVVSVLLDPVWYRGATIVRRSL